MQPFHLSVVVPDLSEIRKFYLEVLQCDLGRDQGSWIDILFFGHQMTFHQENKHRSSVKIDHFGPVLDKAVWRQVAENLKNHNVDFIMPPKLMNENTASESGKFLVNDPAGNLLEFKFYADFNKTLKQ